MGVDEIFGPVPKRSDTGEKYGRCSPRRPSCANGSIDVRLNFAVVAFTCDPGSQGAIYKRPRANDGAAKAWPRRL